MTIQNLISYNIYFYLTQASAFFAGKHRYRNGSISIKISDSKFLDNSLFVI